LQIVLHGHESFNDGVKPTETEVVSFAPNKSSVSETGEALKIFRQLTTASLGMVVHGYCRAHAKPMGNKVSFF
jgi:hypothetical protein